MKSPKPNLTSLELLDVMRGQSLTVQELCARAAEMFPCASALQPSQMITKLRSLRDANGVEISTVRRGGFNVWTLESVSDAFRQRSAMRAETIKRIRSGKPTSATQAPAERLVSNDFNALLRAVREKNIGPEI